MIKMFDALLSRQLFNCIAMCKRDCFKKIEEIFEQLGIEASYESALDHLKSSTNLRLILILDHLDQFALFYQKSPHFHELIEFIGKRVRFLTSFSAIDQVIHSQTIPIFNRLADDELTLTFKASEQLLGFTYPQYFVSSSARDARFCAFDDGSALPIPPNLAQHPDRQLYSSR